MKSKKCHRNLFGEGRSNKDRTQYSLQNLFKFILRLGTLEFPPIATFFRNLFKKDCYTFIFYFILGLAFILVPRLLQ